MFKLKVATFLLTPSMGSDYRCIFGPDANGLFVEELVETTVAQNCGAFCRCVGLENNTCHFGPDLRGDFVLDIVSSEIADHCIEEGLCICDTQPEVKQAFGLGYTFEDMIARREEQARDRSNCRPECPPEPIIPQKPKLVEPEEEQTEQTELQEIAEQPEDETVPQPETETDELDVEDLIDDEEGLEDE